MMPFYDDGRPSTRKYFCQSLQSVLQQKYRDFEVLVLLSGARGFAEQHAQKSGRVRVLYCGGSGGYDQGLKAKIKGLAAARNLGLEKARGEFIAFADADDISESTRLQEQASFLRSHPEIGAVGSCMRIIDSSGKVVGFRSAYESDAAIRRGFLQFNTVPQPTVMARRALLLNAGGYSSAEIAEDYDLWVRIAKSTKFHNLQKPLVRYRVHAGSGATRVSTALYLGSLRVKWRAATSFGMLPSPKDIAVNVLQVASLIFPQSIRRTALEKIRGKLVIGK